MKNREKYREQLDNVPVPKMPCNFIQNVVVPSSIRNAWGIYGWCSKVGCLDCSDMFGVWLEEESDDSRDDPVDTPLEVRDCESVEVKDV